MEESSNNNSNSKPQPTQPIFVAAPPPLINPWRLPTTPAVNEKSAPSSPGSDNANAKRNGLDIDNHEKSNYNNKSKYTSKPVTAQNQKFNSRPQKHSLKSDKWPAERAKVSGRRSAELPVAMAKDDQLNLKDSESNKSSAVSVSSIDSGESATKKSIEFVAAPPPLVNPWRLVPTPATPTSVTSPTVIDDLKKPTARTASPAKMLNSHERSNESKNSKPAAAQQKFHSQQKHSLQSDKWPADLRSGRRSADLPVLTAADPIKDSESNKSSAVSVSSIESAGGEVSPKPLQQFVAAPPPLINPWRSNSSAASVIAKKPPGILYDEQAGDNGAQYNQRKFLSEKWPTVAEAPRKSRRDSQGSQCNGYHHQTNEADSETNNNTIKRTNGRGGGPVQSEESGSVSSRDDLEDDDNDNELSHHDAVMGMSGKGGKRSKQKWVPLSLPETPSSKARLRKERERQRTLEQERMRGRSFNDKENKDVGMNGMSNGNRSSPQQNYVYPPRGRGRGIGGLRGRSPFSNNRGRSYQYSYTNGSTNDMQVLQEQHQGLTALNAKYPDYPSDYTTLPTMYPLTEFIMPYVGDGGYFAPGAVVEDTQVSSGFVPIDNTVLMEMVKKQIEYYFSEENLEKDFYIRRKMDLNGFLPVSFISTFPRIKIMTQDFSKVVQAIQSSTKLELTPDCNYVKSTTEPEKWPIKSTDEIPNGGVDGIFLPQSPTSPGSFLPYDGANSNDSQTDCSLSSDSSLSARADKFNPNVPEFVPKSKVTLTV